MMVTRLRAPRGTAWQELFDALELPINYGKCPFEGSGVYLKVSGEEDPDAVHRIKRL